MMTATVQCPNSACGRVSRLGDDPLGRIFRCPRCLTKLPTAPPTAADARWTARVRQFHSSVGRMSLVSVQERNCIRTAPAGTPVDDWAAADFESGELLVDAVRFEADDNADLATHHRFVPDDSSEVFVGPLSADERALAESSLPTGLFPTGSVCSVERCGLTAGATLSSANETQLGRFQIQSILGEGHHARVFRAYDPILQRDLALKLPREGVLKTAKAIDRFLGEARALARLRHPRIVPVYEAGCSGNQHYIAMALIEGRSLADHLAEGVLGHDRVTEIVADLAEALAYAHDLGIVHRDVKPANVRLDHRGAVYLLDFGIAYLSDSGEVLLPPERILGTPAYMAPEQAQGGGIALPASDQYSLGSVFYHMLCGRPPFSGPPSYVIFHTIHDSPPSPDTIAPKTPRPLAAICLKALAKSPNRRYGDCWELAADLRRWLRGETPSAYRRRWRAMGK